MPVAAASRARTVSTVREVMVTFLVENTEIAEYMRKVRFMANPDPNKGGLPIRIRAAADPKGARRSEGCSPIRRALARSEGRPPIRGALADPKGARRSGRFAV